MPEPNVMPIFMHFVAGLGIFLAVVLAVVIAGFVATIKIFAPKKLGEQGNHGEDMIDGKTLRPGEIYLTSYQIVQIVDGTHVVILDCDRHKDGACQCWHAYLTESDAPLMLLQEAEEDSSRHCSKCDRSEAACRCKVPELIDREDKP